MPGNVTTLPGIEAKNRTKWHEIGEAYVQQWTAIGGGGGLPGSPKSKNSVGDTRKQKRNLSITPDHQIIVNTENNVKQIPQKNKTNNITSNMYNTQKKTSESSSTEMHSPPKNK